MRPRQSSGDLRAVEADKESLHQYCQACREAGDAGLKAEAGMETPTLDPLLAYVPRSAGLHRKEAVS